VLCISALFAMNHNRRNNSIHQASNDRDTQ